MDIFKPVRTTLTIAETEKLRSWFEQGQCEQLREIVRSKVRENLMLASNIAMDSSPVNSYLEGAAVKLREAQRYQTFLTVLEEIIATKANFEIVSVK